MKTGSASSSVDDLFKSLAGRRLESLCKGKKKCVQQLEIYGRATVSIQIQMELIAIMSRVRFSKQLERAILTQGLAHSQAQNVLTRKKIKTFFHTNAWPLATTCLPVELGHVVSLFA